MSNFGGKFTHKGTPPYVISTKFCMGEGVTGPHPSAKFNPFGFKKCGITAPKIAEIGIFW